MSHHSNTHHHQPAYPLSNPMNPYSGDAQGSNFASYKQGYPISTAVPGRSTNPIFAASINGQGSVSGSLASTSSSTGNFSSRYHPSHYMVPAGSNAGYSPPTVVGSSYSSHSMPASPAAASAPGAPYMRSSHTDVPPVYSAGGVMPNISYPMAGTSGHHPQSALTVIHPHHPSSVGYSPYNQLSTEQIYQLYSMRRSVPMQQQSQALPAPGPTITLDQHNQTRDSAAIDGNVSTETDSSSKPQSSLAVEVRKTVVPQNDPSSAVTSGASPGSPNSTNNNAKNSVSSSSANRLPPLSSILSNDTAQTSTKAPASTFSHQNVITSAPESASSQKASPNDYIFPPYQSDNLGSSTSYDRSSVSADSSRMGPHRSGHERSISSPAQSSSALVAKRPIKPKRKRASSFQVSKLNQVFAQTFFPSSELRLSLAMELGMTPRTVQIWFQNKRQGWRSEHNCSVPRDTSMKPLKLSDVFPEKSGNYSENVSVHHHHQHQPHYDHSNSVTCSVTPQDHRLVHPANVSTYSMSQDLSRSNIALPSLNQQNPHQTLHSTPYQTLALPAPRQP